MRHKGTTASTATMQKGTAADAAGAARFDATAKLTDADRRTIVERARGLYQRFVDLPPDKRSEFARIFAATRLVDGKAVIA